MADPAAHLPRRRPWFRARSHAALATAIRRAREESGNTQDEMAARIGSSRPTVSRMERGANVSAGTLLDAINAAGYEIVVISRGAHIVVEAPDE